MKLDADQCYRALLARDPRFDGVFFVGVTTTRIYCRPVCVARTPHRENCRFFPHAAVAEKEGFRPCLRCRPELAPGNAPVDAVGRLARAAVDRIEAGAMADEHQGLEGLAQSLGVSSRQLRRVVRQEFGVSLVELAQTHRLLLAKQLLTETNLSATEVAFTSGFGSVRRFNSLFRSHYRLTPIQLRKSAPSTANGQALHLTLSYRPPLAWDEMLKFLAARALAGVESISGSCYARTVVIGTHVGWVRVEPAVSKKALIAELSPSLIPVLPAVLSKLRNLFDLNAHPDIIATHLGADERLGALVQICPGLRVPGAFDGFELALRAILGQQVSVRAATTLAGRVVAAYGEPVEFPVVGLTHLTPLPKRIAEADAPSLTALGITTARVASIRSLAHAVVTGEIMLEPCPAIEVIMNQLRQVSGIGEWTTAYFAMRALRWPDAFPHSDLGLRKALGMVNARQVHEAAETWRPWRAYAAMHLWNHLHLAEKGR